MLNFILGITIGAAFAPLWIKLYHRAKEYLKAQQQ